MGMIAMLDTWDNPVYVTRVWTMFEQYTAQELGIPIEMIMSPSQNKGFEEQLDLGRSGLKKVMDSLMNIDVEKAQATAINDERKVKKTIRTTVGFDAVNEKVKAS